MIERLAQGPMPVSRLAEPFAMSAPAISKHVRVLERAGLLRREVRGRTHICHAQGDALRAAERWLDRQRQYWEQSLDALEEYFHKHPNGGNKDDSR
jgi:DNA-binding transcriptional ArsR family regulator